MSITRLNPEYAPSDTGWRWVNNNLAYRVAGGFCTVRGNSGAGGVAAGSTAVTVGTLPEQARPSMELGGAGTAKGAGDLRWAITSAGVVSVANYTASSTYWAFTVTYAV